MKQKQQNMPTERLHLTTIVYREGEWAPELLKKEARDRYMYCEIPKMQSISRKQEKSSVQINSKAKISEYADLIKDTMIQKNVDPQNLLYIAATEESIRAAQMLGLATLGYDNRSCMKHDIAKKANSFSSVKMIVEGFEEVDALFLERVYEREHHLPWEIARTDRWILREFTMDDMDGLVELYDQPGVSYRIENGKKFRDILNRCFRVRRKKSTSGAILRICMGITGMACGSLQKIRMEKKRILHASSVVRDLKTASMKTVWNWRWAMSLIRGGNIRELHMRFVRRS